VHLAIPVEQLPPATGPRRLGDLACSSQARLTRCRPCADASGIEAHAPLVNGFAPTRRAAASQREPLEAQLRADPGGVFAITWKGGDPARLVDATLALDWT
jgi:hypothetical protein